MKTAKQWLLITPILLLTCAAYGQKSDLAEQWPINPVKHGSFDARASMGLIGQSLDIYQSRLINNLLKYMEKEVVVLEAKGRDYPLQGYQEAATELKGHLVSLKQKKFVQGIPFSGANAYVSFADRSTMNLTPTFFKPPSLIANTTTGLVQRHETATDGKSNLRGRLRLTKQIRYGELTAILIHELVHSEKQGALTLSREKPAYIIEYKWLRLLNDDKTRKYNQLAEKDGSRAISQIELANTLDWLQHLGVLDKSTDPDELKRSAKKWLDPLFGLTDKEIFPKEDWLRLTRDLPREPIVPVGVVVEAEKDRLRKAVNAWKTIWLDALWKARENDPARLRNKQEYLAKLRTFQGGPRKLTCASCGFSGNHWWFEDRWSCPNCEHCTMPSQVLGKTGGGTHIQFARRRMRLYDDKRAEINRRAYELLTAIDQLK